jgi:MFS family permease
MAEKLHEEVKKRLVDRMSPGVIRTELIQSGFAENDIDQALKEVANVHVSDKDHHDKRNSKIFAIREFIDRMGYGAASPQFINILFYMSGSGIFLLGLFNGLKTVISMLVTAVLQEYSKVHRVSRNVISTAGIIFGFSFLMMAFAVRARAVWLFAIALLIAGIGVVTYGDLYNKFILEILRREKMGAILKRMGQFGVLITMIGMLLSGWLMERFPETGERITLSLFGTEFALVPIGYLISFEITAFAFIISGYLLSFLHDKRESRHFPLGKFIKQHYKALFKHCSGFMHQKYTLLLLLATITTGLLEVLGQSYYGIFIYETFKYQAFGGFLNVAVLYSIAILVSFTGPWFTSRLQRSIGLSPMLVFGTLLMAILPLTLFYNPNILAVALALGCSVIGAAIVGIAQGLLTRKLMNEELRKKYFMSLGIFVALPYLILVPLGAWLASVVGLKTLFLAIGIGLALVVMPLYFVLVAMANKERL